MEYQKKKKKKTIQADLPFYKIAFNLFRPYVQDSPETGIPDTDLLDILERSFSTFSHPDVTPVVKLPNVSGDSGDLDRLHVLELFHGYNFVFIYCDF